MTRLGRTLCFAALGAVVYACTDDKANVVAELSGRSGVVDRDFADAPERWSDALLGTRFAMGDGLRTGPASSARIELSPEGSALVEPNTLVRFSAEAPGDHSQQLVLEAGGVEIVTDRFELVVHTPRAVARLDHRSKVKVYASREGGAARIEVSVGRASVLRRGERDAMSVAPGETRSLAEVPSADASAAAPAPLATPVPDTLVDAGPLEIDAAIAPRDAAPSSAEAARVSPGGESVDVRVGIAERAWVHVARLPAQVAIVLPPCADASALSAGKQTIAEARGSAVVRLPAGRHELRYRCGGQEIARGSLSVRRDEARAVIAGRPPEVSVATDGRRYQVRHSGNPPSLRVRWPDAPSPGPYTLSVSSNGRTREYPSPEPLFTLAPRELGLGPVALSFRDERGNVSRITNVEVSFDDSSHLLQWTAPRELAARTASPLVVQGTVLPGARVRIGDRELTVLSTGQFRGEVTTPGADAQLVADVMHPLLGRHYYVRRLR